MKFSITINKWANFYFFVQNLSEWNSTFTRKEYNPIWRKRLGSFSFGEKKALKKFKEIHLKYPFEKFYIGHYFFAKRNFWNILEKKYQKKISIISGKSFLCGKRNLKHFIKKNYPC